MCNGRRCATACGVVATHFQHMTTEPDGSDSRGIARRTRHIDRRSFIALTGSGVVGSMAGCAGLTDGDESDAGGAETDEDAPDFGGKELNVTLNVGAFAEVFKKNIIPTVEEKYNLNINFEAAVTTSQLTKIQANPENPPDVAMLDVIGVEKGHREGWLEPLDDHTDILTNYADIYDKFKHYDHTGVSWEVGEVFPVVNTDQRSVPTTWDEAMTGGDSMALVPFSWSAGPYLLLMASAIATGEDFGSDSLDVEAGFEYLENNLKPNVSTEYGGVASAKQQIASGNIDTIMPFWAYMVFDMHLNDSPVEGAWRCDPAGIPVAETLVVPKGSNNKEAAMYYVNEALSVEFQETMSAAMGAGVTNMNAEVSDVAKQYGVTTPDKFDQLTYPDFGYIWENRDEWSDRWNEIFSG